jgi:hypothetical protein
MLDGVDRWWEVEALSTLGDHPKASAAAVRLPVERASSYLRGRYNTNSIRLGPLVRPMSLARVKVIPIPTGSPLARTLGATPIG